jgi:hypothetical protein
MPLVNDLKERRILDSFTPQDIRCCLRHVRRVCGQLIGVGTPVDLHATGKVDQGIGLDADAGDAWLLTLDKYSTGTTERI